MDFFFAFTTNDVIYQYKQYEKTNDYYFFITDFTEFFTIKTEKFIAALIIFHNFAAEC